MAELKKHSLMVMVSESMKQALDNASDREDISIGEFVRRAIKNELNRLEKPLKVSITPRKRHK